MHLIDTHCHVDLYDDPDAVISEVEENRIYTLAMTNLPSAFKRVERLLYKRKYLRPALGLHPQNAYRYHYELEFMFNLLDRTKYIGEIGLDYSTNDYTDRRVQRHVFDRILEHCSLAGNKILSIHSRQAEFDVINSIGSDFNGKIILHWFTGSKKLLEKAISNGHFFSINSAMLSTKRGTELISIIPQNRLLSETDGPYNRIKNRPVEPVNVNVVIQSLSSLLKIEPKDVTGLIYQNFQELLMDKD